MEGLVPAENALGRYSCILGKIYYAEKYDKNDDDDSENRNVFGQLFNEIDDHVDKTL